MSRLDTSKHTPEAKTDTHKPTFSAEMDNNWLYMHSSMPKSATANYKLHIHLHSDDYNTNNGDNPSQLAAIINKFLIANPNICAMIPQYKLRRLNPTKVNEQLTLHRTIIRFLNTLHENPDNTIKHSHLVTTCNNQLRNALTLLYNRCTTIAEALERSKRRIKQLHRYNNGCQFTFYLNIRRFSATGLLQFLDFTQNQISTLKCKPQQSPCSDIDLTYNNFSFRIDQGTYKRHGLAHNYNYIDPCTLNPSELNAIKQQQLMRDPVVKHLKAAGIVSPHEAQPHTALSAWRFLGGQYKTPSTKDCLSALRKNNLGDNLTPKDLAQAQSYEEDYDYHVHL